MGRRDSTTSAYSSSSVASGSSRRSSGYGSSSRSSYGDLESGWDSSDDSEKMSNKFVFAVIAIVAIFGVFSAAIVTALSEDPVFQAKLKKARKEAKKGMKALEEVAAKYEKDVREEIRNYKESLRDKTKMKHAKTEVTTRKEDDERCCCCKCSCSCSDHSQNGKTAMAGVTITTLAFLGAALGICLKDTGSFIITSDVVLIPGVTFTSQAVVVDDISFLALFSCFILSFIFCILIWCQCCCFKSFRKQPEGPYK